MNNAKFVIQVSKGLVRNARARRLLMFYSVIIALVMLFAGSTFLWSLLREHPLIFLAFWAICAWITLFVVLLALYDMVKVRSDALRLRRQLERDYVEKMQREADEDARG